MKSGLPAFEMSKLWGTSTAFARLSFLSALALGLVMGATVGFAGGGSKLGLALIGVLGLTLMALLRQDQLVAVLLLAIAICVDGFVGTHVISLIGGAFLLVFYYLTRSKLRPWGGVRPWGLWVAFLLITLPPALSPIINGVTTSTDTIYYYPGVILPAFVMFGIGLNCVHSLAEVRRFFCLTAAFATGIALHSIIQARTGVLLFATANAQAYLLSVSDYQLSSTGVSRVGSFFLQPDAGSAFLAMMLFLPLGLYVVSKTFWTRVLYVVETVLILMALLFTYSTGAWLAASAGVLVFFCCVGSMRVRWQLGVFLLAAGLIFFLRFRYEFNLLLQHSQNPQDLIIRQGLWQTALGIIEAYPLTGIGLSRFYYYSFSANFHVFQALMPLNNPHNSYLELAAMAGLPVLVIFLALIGYGLWCAVDTWWRSDAMTRALWAAGLASIVTLCLNNWSFGLWTFPQTAVGGWLILGVLASPFMRQATVRYRRSQKTGKGG